jgi:hypothetical protein
MVLWKLARQTVLLVMLALVSASGALAHLKNEETQFPDIEFSDARFDVVLLAAAGIIPETPVFEPDRPLNRRDLAAWVALARGLGKGGETPNTDVLAQAALTAGAVASIDGEATFGELAAVFFPGQATRGREHETPTKAAAAQFVASHLTTATESGTLLDRVRISAGPTGVITAVESQAAGHDHGTVYVVTIGETKAPADAHARLANGPIDLLVWEGRVIRRSLSREIDGEMRLIYLEAEPHDASTAKNIAASDAAPAAAAEELSSAAGPLLYGLLASVALLGVLLFARRRRVH